MVGFTGGAGTVDNAGLVYEWSEVITVIENNVIVDFFTQFSGKALPGATTDVTIGNFNVQLSQLSYRNIGGAVGVHDLTLAAGATFTQLASDFLISGRLVNNSLMTIYANTTITGSIANNSLITIGAGDTNQRFVRLKGVDGDFTISGSGDIRLRDGFLTGHGGPETTTHLSIASTITGFGTIGSDFGRLSFPRDGSSLAMTNTAAGTIEANVADKTLTIQPETSIAVVNAGMMAASNGGILYVNGANVDQVLAGTLRAYNGASVVLNNSVITGGTLDGRGTGAIKIEGSTTRLADLDITATGTVYTGRYVYLDGTIENRGKIISDSFEAKNIIGTDGVTLTGSGVYKLVGSYSLSAMYGEAAGAVLTNDGHTIQGVGTILGGNLTVVNDGLIAATPDSYSDVGTDELALDALAGLRNTGILEASGGAMLRLSFMQGVDNTDGLIRARGDGSIVGLREMSLSGGTFATTGTGKIVALGFNVVLSDFELTAGSTMDATMMTFNGDVANRGNMSMNGEMSIDGTATLTGGGTFRIYDNYNGSYLVGKTAGAVLNNVDNTILGDGGIGARNGLFNLAGNLSVINSGVIAADFDPYNASFGLALVELVSLTNSGLLLAQNGATLSIKNPYSGAIENAGGVIRATGAGSVVSLGDTVISGGKLEAIKGGSFTVGNVTFDGRTSAMTSNLDLNLTAGSVTLKGDVVNTGDIVTSVGAKMVIGADTTLTGGGSITINPTYHFSILPLTGPAGTKLTNIDNTLAGSGSFGSNTGIVLINAADGVVTANQVGNTLHLETGSTITNRGTLLADGGILNIVDNVTGPGRIEARNGGTLIVDQGTDQALFLVGSGSETVSLSRREDTDGGFDFAINGLGLGDRINLNIGAGVGSEASFTLRNTASGVILTSTSFSSDSTGRAYDIRLNGTYSYGQFQLIGGADGYLGYVRVASHDGGAGNDLMTALAKGERVIGLKGNDTLISGAGDDLLDGSQGTDMADFRKANAGVTVSLATSEVQAVGGGLGNDRLISIETLSGSNFADSLTGNDGANGLTGGVGNDTLNGGAGKDQLTGGLGSDQFIFDTALGGGNVDVITDYKAANDVIFLDDAIFAGLAIGALEAKAFVANTTGLATKGAHHIIYQKTNGNLYFDADGVGGADGIQFAKLSPQLAGFNAGEFVLF